MTEAAGGASGGRGRPGLLRRALHRLAADPDQLHAEELQEDVPGSGARPVRDCSAGHVVTVTGTLRSVLLRPLGGAPTLEAELYDGSGSVMLIWLGRRRITGIEPGRSVTACGRVAMVDGVRVIYNPRYELRAAPSPATAAET